MAKHSGQFLFPAGHHIAEMFIKGLKGALLCDKIEAAGSLRRRKETVKNVDLIASSSNPDELMETFVTHPEIKTVTARGIRKSSVVLKNGIAADLRVVTDKQFAPALLYFTGSKEHNTRLRSLAKKMGYKLNEYGLFKGNSSRSAATEEKIYNVLGCDYIPPELREGDEELECAARSEIPALIVKEDIKGIIHVHTSYSDGYATLREMAEEVKKSGFDYLGVSDHSQSAHYAGGLKPWAIKQQHDEIDKLNEELAPFRIFKGIESDIRNNGSLDYEEKILERFDFIIASVHSGFSMKEKKMTGRILTAIRNPFTTILGHPTGRLLLSCDGYQVNMDRVLEAAAEAGVAIELNSNPYRLDLDWRFHKKAGKLGIPIPICPDAHVIEGIHDIDYGVGIARKGWLTKKDVLTSWETNKVEEYFNMKR